MGIFCGPQEAKRQLQESITTISNSKFQAMEVNTKHKQQQWSNRCGEGRQVRKNIRYGLKKVCKVQQRKVRRLNEREIGS